MLKIRTSLCSFLLMSLVCFSTSAQTRHQLSLGIGGPSGPEFVTVGVWKKRGLVGIGSTDLKSSGAWQLAYNYAIGDGTSVGLAMVWEKQKVVKTGAPMPENEGKFMKYTDTYSTLLIDVRHHWARRKVVSWYSGIAPGVSIYRRKEVHNDFTVVNNDDILTVKPAWQVTAIGFSAGKRLRGYAELGYGYRGVLTGGLSYGF